MPRPKLSVGTKQCREDLRVLALWRLSKGPLKRAALRTWLAGSVDGGWGRKGRPRDLRAAEEEADATIDHLLRHGSCEAAGDGQNQTIRLVLMIPALEKRVIRIRLVEAKARQEAGKVSREGGPADVADALPGAWVRQAVNEVGERAARAIEKAVLEDLKRGADHEVHTSASAPDGVIPGPDSPPCGTTAPPSGAATAADGKGPAGPAVPAGRPGQHAVGVVMLPVSRLRPNPWNPNTMTEEEEAQQLEEVRRHKGIPHPLLVRHLKGAYYEILDGEHSWAAAKKTGLSEVPSHVVKVNDFEAMRLTFVRGQHGTRDRLRTGRLFRQMLDLAGVAADASATSLRQFARENNISDATVRNYLLYATAAEVRKAYAPETADETIRGLSVVKLRLYLDLPEGRRDVWLDRGARSDEADTILAEAASRPRGSRGRGEATRPGATGRGGASAGPGGVAEPEEEQGEVPPGGGNEGLAGDQAGPEPCPQEEGTAQGGEQPEPAVATGPSEAGEPLSQAERDVVDGVLRSYRDDRPPVRHKILGGLGAYPDAVAFFRRMLKGGT
jgi:ParB family chromosome partitioning protein